MTLEEKENLITLFEKYSNFLPQSQKQALHLHLMEDLSLREIAAILATSHQAVFDAIKKGKNKLLKIDEKL